MTDSMKFGPEWLRNMSADSISPGTNNLGSGNTSNNNSSSNLSNISASGANLNNSNTASPTPSPRNMFPEFRYGREEMLLLFDKNCNLPEILPSFKKIYVEKVQFPLALTPSTDEEIIPPGPAISAQRPQWPQRSPVGFSSAVRGTSRGGSAERGRMRGKLGFHSTYPRPAAMFDDDLRLTSLKSERGWSERNGGNDTLGVGLNSAVHGSEWNGTPSSSPRKEFTSYSRNTENWRRNRNEDNTGDATPGGSMPSTEGWRGGSTTSSFGSNHRWGRSTSWRDEDVSIEGISFSPTGVPMQRSYSTIATGADRIVYIGGISKSTSQNSTFLTSGGTSPPNRGINSSAGNDVQSPRCNQWPPGGDGRNGNCCIDGEDNLPEWAMENASDIGGTFDATGAFHGSVYDDDHVDNNTKELRSSQQKLLSSTLKETAIKSDENVESLAEDKSSTSGEQYSASSTSLEICKSSDQKQLPQPVNSNELNASEKEPLEPQSQIQNQHMKAAGPKNQTSKATISATMNISPTNNLRVNTSFYSSDLGRPLHVAALQHTDYSEYRMKEVADDMVQKLIMDDDSVVLSASNGNVGDGNHVTHADPVPNPFVSPSVAAILKQTAQQQAAQNVVRVSPTSTSIGGSKPIPLYGGGVVVDHDTLHQHHLQQQQLTAGTDTPDMPLHGLNASANFWYYRDPQSKVQGPFTAIEMTEWYRAGYFDENLSVRRLCDMRFRSLGALTKLCQGNMPFTHSHLIPLNLDAIHIPNSTPGISPLRDNPPVLLDYSLKQAAEQRDEIKDSIPGGGEPIKNLINTADMSHMINIQFQEYMRHHEMLLATELSKNECFLRLTPSEKEAIVRQKIQLGGLPDYIAGLTGLDSSMPTLGNPNAGSQMYETIGDCAKKDHIFSGGDQPHTQHQTTAVKTFIDAGYTDILHSQQQAQFSGRHYGNLLGSPNIENNEVGKMLRPNESLTGNELLNEFNLRMFLRGGGVTANTPNLSSQQSKHFMSPVNPNNFLIEQQLMVPTANAQNPMMQMWIPPAINAHVPIAQQTLMMNQQHNQNQWNGPAVALSNSVMAPSSISSTGSISPAKPMPPSTWDMAAMQQKEPNQKLEQNIINFDHHNKGQSSLPTVQSKERTLQSQYPEEHKDNESLPELSNQLPPTKQQEPSTATPLVSESTIINKQHKEDRQPEKPQSVSIKRNITINSENNSNVNKQQAVPVKLKDETKRSEEDRRREQAEEKRRQKEEKKRYQAEDEKRRSQQIEDEKRRQIQEEKERQQQIQAQRRKALLGASSASSMSTSTLATTALSTTKPDKDNRLHSSVAPWSSQTTSAASKNGPCLAEIQKAERRERRADQQRQMEMIVRANAVATSEINDTILTWNASPMPVKSFAEIQAEESKRLVAEHLETQRRKEQEQQQMTLTQNLLNANSGPGLSSSSFPGIWTGAKVWGSTSNSGFWEEPIKFSAAVSANNAAGAGSNHIGRKQGQTVQQQQQKSLSSSNNQTPGNTTRNLRKSQTVTVMQNDAPIGKNPKANQQAQTGLKPSSKVSQKPDNDNKKGHHKNNNNNHATNTSVACIKKDDMEHEFTVWCTKGLSGMNAKVDVPTFVTFLQDLESPYEVKDYIRMYLGESKEYTDFAKQFLERRSKYRNLQRAQNAHNDDMCKPAPAITPSGNDSSENKNKQKKMKKNKMTKLDARILGFSVTAAEGRINVGDRDYVDAP